MDEKSGFREQMPHTIGRYQVQESIGYGAMGAVYKAFDPLIKRTLAIKTIRLDIPRQSPQYKSFIERFYHEARISGTLSHPNIVTLFDIGEEGGIPYLAMEFVEGETISSLIEQGVRFNPEKVIGLISQIAAAVDYAHSKGVIHRDIKPSNLILSGGDRVKVTDFGIAKLVDAEMTQSGTLLGTPSYMSPEQAMGDKLDGRSDIFSLGVCAFEMLAGEQPFPGNNVTSILYKLVHVDPIEPANLEMNGLVPQKWHEVFGRVLAKKPDDRYQTSTEFVQDLEYCLGAWFGAAMGEDAAEPGTLARTAQSEKAGGSGGSRSGVAMSARAAATDGGSTTLLPVYAESNPYSPVVRESAARDEAPATMNLQAPSVAPAEPRNAPAPAARTERTERHKVARAEGAGSPEATLLIKAPSLPAPAPGGDAPLPTVMMTAGQLAAHAKSLGKAAPPVSVPPEVTVVMSSAELARGGSDPTVRAKAASTDGSMAKPAPPPGPAARKAPATPKTVPPTRPMPTPLPGPPAVVTPAAEPPPEGGFLARLPPAALLGGAAVMFLLAAVIVGVLLWGGGSEAVAPTPGPAPVASHTPEAATPAPVASVAPPIAPGRLLVDSQPAGADVTLNGDFRGITPLDLTGLALGVYEVKMELKGFEPRTQSISLTADVPQSQVRASLSRLGPAMGSAEIESTPMGASVTIDGARAGITPLPDYKVKVGNHRVDIALDGYESWSGNLVVQLGTKGRVEAQLRPIPKVAATPVPTPTAEPADANRAYVEPELDGQVKKLSGPSTPQPRLKPGESLSVSVDIVVVESGDVSDARVDESSGNKSLDDAVLAMVRGSKYTSPLKRGAKVKARIRRKFTFKAG